MPATNISAKHFDVEGPETVSNDAIDALAKLLVDAALGQRPSRPKRGEAEKLPVEKESGDSDAGERAHLGKKRREGSPQNLPSLQK